LACEELRVVEQEVARRLSLPLLPCCPICGESVDNWLRFAGISHDEAKKWLSSERDQLVVFCVATAREFEDDDRDGEFPEGEELDAADKSQLVAVEGYCNGGALMALCEYLVLKQESATALDVFLEKTRTPHRKQFAKRLKVVFDALPKSQSGGRE
jgi:hypothetical protein